MKHEVTKKRDFYGELCCKDCKYWKKHCKRVDHENLSFYIPIFNCYEYTSFMGDICKDFEPTPNYKWLFDNFDGIDGYLTDYDMERLIPFRIKGDKAVYYCRFKDFYNNTHIRNGELQWVKKRYTERCLTTATKRKIVIEENGERK